MKIYIAFKNMWPASKQIELARGAQREEPLLSGEEESIIREKDPRPEIKEGVLSRNEAFFHAKRTRALPRRANTFKGSRSTRPNHLPKDGGRDCDERGDYRTPDSSKSAEPSTCWKEEKKPFFGMGGGRR